MKSLQSFLFDQAIRATLLLVAAYLVTFAMRRASASARRLVWVAAAACLLAMPVLSLLLPPVGAGRVRGPAPRRGSDDQRCSNPHNAGCKAGPGQPECRGFR